jgi:hypothetical protein
MMMNLKKYVASTKKWLIVHEILFFSPQNTSILRRKQLVLDLAERPRHSGYGQVHSLRFSHSLSDPYR